jgi:hypothetical protein
MDYKVNGGVVRKISTGYELQIGAVIIPIEEEMAHRLVIVNLMDASLLKVGVPVPPEIAKHLLWHVNERKSSIFFNDLYPEWSVVPNPRKWVAGNIFFEDKRNAEERLAKLLKMEIAHQEDEAAKEISGLQKTLDSMKERN